MKLFMVKARSSDDDSTAWFFVSAPNEDGVRTLIEDCTTTIVELLSDPSEIAEVVRKEFDYVALVAGL